MNKKIAIVEDEAILQTALKEWFETDGYEVLAITTGKEALEQIPKEKPDLILLDVILPEINGFEVMKKLKASEETRHIPIVILSNLGDEQNRKRALELGAIDFLLKAEHDLDEVRKRVGQILDKKSNLKLK